VRREGEICAIGFREGGRPVQKHRLIAREIIFIVPPGPESGGGQFSLYPPGHKSGGTMLRRPCDRPLRFPSRIPHSPPPRPSLRRLGHATARSVDRDRSSKGGYGAQHWGAANDRYPPPHPRWRSDSDHHPHQ